MAGQGIIREDKYCFSDDIGINPIQTHHLVDQLQTTFQQNTSQIYTSSNHHHHHHVLDDHKSNNSQLWRKGSLFFSGSVHGGATTTTSSSSKPEFYDHHETLHDHDQDDDQEEEDDDDESSRVHNWQQQQHHHHHHHVFPCEGNERPSQGLSLSLSSTNPTAIGLQSFELRPQQQQQEDLTRFVSSDHGQHDLSSFFTKPMNNNNNNNDNDQHHGQFDQIRNSKYLIPAQDLLNEFCNLGTKQQQQPQLLLRKPHKDNYIDHHHLHLDLLQLHKRKSKLLSILEQLDRKYRHYCEQMKAVVSSFESVAGTGGADVYSRMASKAMSKHFRCLRDGIVGQIKATKKAMGEKDIAAPGTTRGETPRLRVLDQNLRQQKAFQQMTLMETHPWRPQRGLPERSVSVLRAWLFEHFLHPYPSDVDKHILARQTGLSRSQVSNWFINARVRLWKPMVEEMYTEELREAQMEAKPGVPEGVVDEDYNVNSKPLACAGQLTRIDSECLSSVINNNNNNGELLLGKNRMGFGNAFGGAVELDFSTSYAVAGGSGGGGGGVSLTLELQQHGGGGNGVSLAFSPAAGQSSLFYNSREDCQPVQYLLEGDDDQGQNLPYRFLMGAQLLNDLAG